MSEPDARRHLLGRVYRTLRSAYGTPPPRKRTAATDVLVETILSQNTNDRNSQEGFRRLKAAFANWADVERAPWREVANAIRVSGLANIKARRIQDILRRIRDERGDHSLEFLGDWATERAREYLERLPGVGPKTAACVLLFAFGKPAFPVDTHILRVGRRLGLLAPDATSERAHEEMQRLVPPRWVYPLHLLMIRHGRETCHARAPRCPQCPLLPLCPTGRSLRKTLPKPPQGLHARHSKTSRNR